MTTASDILSDAARTLGYLGFTETLGAADANRALTTLNQMLDSWSNEKLFSFFTLERSFTLTIGQQQYTIGSGGNINTTRPYDIIQAYVRDTSNLDYPLAIVPQDEWNNIGQKNITSQIPTTLFYDSQYPLGVINIFPVPLLPYTVFYDSTSDQVDFSALTTTLSMPPGYELAYVMNLAVLMMQKGWPCLLDQFGKAALIKSADDSKANVKRRNIKEVKAAYDDAIVSKSYATYNIYSDGNPRA